MARENVGFDIWVLASVLVANIDEVTSETLKTKRRENSEMLSLHKHLRGVGNVIL